MGSGVERAVPGRRARFCVLSMASRCDGTTEVRFFPRVRDHTAAATSA